MYQQLSGFIIACSPVFPLLAQSPADTIPLGWRRGGTGTINFSQVSLHNWAAGGQSAISVLGITNLFWHHKAASSSCGPTTWTWFTAC